MANTWMEKAKGAMTRAKSASQKYDKAIDNMVRSGLVFASSFAWGFAQGKKERVWWNMPAPLLVGLGLQIASHTKFGGGHAEHLLAIADGTIAAYGAGLGAAAAARSK